LPIGSASGFQLRKVRPRPASQTPLRGRAGPTVYLRLSIPEEIDERIVLYLDCDVVALDDLLPLQATDLSGKPIAAVRDPWNPVTGAATALPNRRELCGARRTRLLQLRRDAARPQRTPFARPIRAGMEVLATHPGEAGLWDQDDAQRRGRRSVAAAAAHGGGRDDSKD
jgi:hypothetical protein